MAFKFEKLEIWQLAIDYVDLIYELTEKLPKDEKYNLKSQLRRAATSIALNIAEGSGKQSEKELGRFIEISLGSAYETLANLDILQSNKLIEQDNFYEAEKLIKEICKQLGAFKKKLDL